MRDGVKFIGSMFGWAIFCSLLIGILPRNPPAYLSVPLAGFCLLGFVWMPTAAITGWKDANKLTSLTFLIWASAGAFALIAVLLSYGF